MKTKLALLFVLLSVAAHTYLTLHYYEINFGMSTTESICNLNSKFNCDAVAASSFSSLLGAPLALWGAVANGVLALMILFGLLGWANSEEKQARASLWLSTLIGAASLVMAGISTFLMNTYCLFCIAAYVFSILTMILLRLDLPPSKESLFSALRSTFTQGYSYLAVLLSIPLATFFLNKAYAMNIGADKLPAILNSTIAEWKSSPVVDFTSVSPSFTKGSTSPKMIIYEFADFRCGHCKVASKTFNVFMGSRNDVQLQFFSFPLDGTCNEALGKGGDGISCYLAKAVACAEKTSQKGAALHNEVFARQEKINSTGSLESIKEILVPVWAELALPVDGMNACIEAPETDQMIRAQAKLGEKSGVTGTPSIFVNGRKLTRGQLIQVLDAAHGAL